MQTVNFHCGNCNNLMAVSAEYLGQQVRCPHCQAVVVAPASAAPAPAPAPAAPAPAPFTTPMVNEQEDIFAPPAPTDDLFGGPEAPRLEMPPSGPPAPPLPPTIAIDGPAAPAGAEALGATMTYPGPQPAAPAGDATIPSWMDSPAAPAPAPAGAATETAAPAPGEIFQPTVRKPRDSGGWFIGLVFIPLVSYSVLVTILAVYLFYRVSQEAASAAPAPNQAGPSPLETLPSFDPNDAEHSTHLKILPGKLNRAGNIDLAVATAALPTNQIVPLEKKLRLGDLEIEPLRIEREVVAVMVDGFQKPEKCPNRSLVLTLKLRNVSENVVFQPMDSYFDRKWDPKGGGAPPLTILELTGADRKDRFLFGGPADYHAPPGSSDWVVRYADWVDLPQKGSTAKHTDELLSPGEEKEFFVCTDGGLKAGDKGKDADEAIENYHGKLVWRVHLRRGVEVVNEHRYVPVSTVIGVEFTDEDYRRMQ